MMIGPAPMIRTLLMSVRLGMFVSARESAMRLVPFHHSNETVEQITDVMRSGTCFRMPLKTKCRLVGPGKTLEASVKQRNVRNFDICRQRCRVHRESMVLAGDHDPPGLEILYRMIRAMVTEFHLERSASAGQPKQLVAQTNAKGRHGGIEQFPDCPDRVVARLGVARTVRQEHAVGP